MSRKQDIITYDNGSCVPVYQFVIHIEKYIYISSPYISLQWRQNERDGV